MWLKLKYGQDSKYVTLYTKDKELAVKYKLLPRKNGQYFYRNRSCAQIKKHLFGFGDEKDRRRYAYIRMMRSYPPVADIQKRYEKVPTELLRKMEVDMGWDNVNKTWNGYDIWLKEREEQELNKWIEKLKKVGLDYHEGTIIKTS